jgi:ABC-type multidrug transport system ATPase subunit
MDEAKLCDRIALIQGGKIMSVDKPDAIVMSFPKTLFAAKAKNIYQLLENLRADANVESCYAFGKYLHLTLTSDSADVEQLRELASQYNPDNLEVKVITPVIEDSFIRMMREQGMDKAPTELNAAAHGK